MTPRIPQIILALAILTPYASVHSQSTKAFNGFALVDSGNISKPPTTGITTSSSERTPSSTPRGIRCT